jgi:hypothetical protein
MIFLQKKGKQNENMKTKTEICGTETDFLLAEVLTEMERRFLMEQMRKQTFPFLTNTYFLFYGCFAWLI